MPDKLDVVAKREIEAIRWFHSIPLGDVITAGQYDPSRTLGRLGLPDRLDGLSVLDVGAWDGFYSFEVERRGASRVLATDSYSWSGAGWGTKDGFLCARRILQSRVEDLDIEPNDITVDKVGTFDLVLFLGVIYHLQDPLAALRALRTVTAGTIIVESIVWSLHRREPAIHLFPESFDQDDSNWFAPTEAGLSAMLRVSGFRDVRVEWRRGLVGRAAKVGYYTVRRKRQGLRRPARFDRVVISARVAPNGSAY